MQPPTITVNIYEPLKAAAGTAQHSAVVGSHIRVDNYQQIIAAFGGY